MHDGDVTAAGEDARAGSGAAETAGARRGVCAATVMVPGAGKKGRGEAFFFLKSVSLTNSALFRF
jgi:hypothetical protein